MADFEVALAALRHKIRTKQGKIFENIRVVIVNAVEKLVSPCECMENNEGFEILSGLMRR